MRMYLYDCSNILAFIHACTKSMYKKSLITKIAEKRKRGGGGGGGDTYP